jgi:hypothetical protein
MKHLDTPGWLVRIEILSIKNGFSEMSKGQDFFPLLNADC